MDDLNLAHSEDENVDIAIIADCEATSVKSKKKRKPKRKKATPISKSQSNPPRVPVADLFPNASYPVGEIVEYTDENAFRTTNEEKRLLDRMNDDFLADYHQGAEVHRQVRQWTQQYVRPGQTLMEIANGIEDSVRALVGHQGLEEGDGMKAGIGFPTGLSINSCASHYTPNTGNTTVLQQEDVMKVDVGVHVNGRIVDSAFTVAFEPRYDNLLMAVKDATNAGIRTAGIDVRISDIGSAIQEVMESYEVELNGNTIPIKCIRNLNGHNIDQYNIHGGKMVPIVRNQDQTKMEEGEIYAIETFGTTGKGFVREDLETSHYVKVADMPNVPLRLSSAKSVLNTITKNFGTLPFCRRYLDRLREDRYLLGVRSASELGLESYADLPRPLKLNSLVSTGLVKAYPPLSDIKGSYTAQFEHTILLRPTVKEVVSRGDDY